ncbi:acyltransferase [Pokkaliibacter sp. CJK22405]|uniref:acyltransferase n=1 Tax=Pokkaliibacter sp. CJK22405 TaxID=3384615 RepID=UPI003984764F
MMPLFRGLLTSLLLLACTVVCILPLILLGLIKALLPFPGGQHLLGVGVRFFARSWARINRRILLALLPTRWVIDGREHLHADRSALVLCNHQSWVDIPCLVELMLDRAPFFTFFLKRQLIWVPFVGLACWALDYPFMRRHSREAIARNPGLAHEDLATTRRACEKLRGRAVSLVNYVEGTRFTPAKQAAQQSPYRHLLRPKAGGVAFTLNAMGDQISTVLDVTLFYPQGIPNFWQFLSGQVQEVRMQVVAHEVPAEFRAGNYQQDASYRRAVQDWLNGLWQEKDQRIARWQSGTAEETKRAE